MPSYCCFWCPSNDFSERSLKESCPRCGRKYGNPLEEKPQKIGPYRVENSITRGFYGAVYRARQESLDRAVVLKVTPVELYRYFNKDWEAECKEHARIGEGTPFVAQITDQFTVEVSFGESTIQCHVAVLASIDGPTLEQVLSSRGAYRLEPRQAAQVAADLFEIFHLFARQGCSHNDLHAGNIIIQSLSLPLQRSGAIDPTTRAVAVDLGSTSDASRSGDHHIGDQHQVAKHLASLSSMVRDSPVSQQNDIDFRIAGVLRGLAEHLSPAAGAQRVMTPEDCLRTIRSAIRDVDEPWRQPLSLHRFGDAYNAQALESWHVPQLWIDPKGRWLKKTTGRGPQVITGMRGCGKTMLLRALHFHARATEDAQSMGKNRAKSVLARDQFFGVYASCQKLLDPQNRDTSRAEIPRPFERLFVAYLRDAVQVLRHLRSLDATQLVASIDKLLIEALTLLSLQRPDISEERSFEQYLLKLQFDLADGEIDCRLKMAPAEAFGQLATILRKAAPALSNKYVLFLLDDVSTRYLTQEMVSNVISKLLFQSPDCGFRITTEAQALHRILLSPGGGAPADPSRDYEEFNLGNEVYRLLQEGSTTSKMEFIANILLKRGSQFSDPIYSKKPLAVLGDVKLEEIAEEIAMSTATSPTRKRSYRGFRAVQAVCVGDLGDVVKLYERILQRATLAELPVPAQKQADCFLEHSANLMHFLNRRDQVKKSLALAFAQAAGDLLHRSARASGKNGNPRLRQYTKLYVRVDAGPEFESVASRILDLLDAGVFVYDGGVPRTKTHDDDPVLQFKLSYRKMLGLASFIGLSDRDRFELSGSNLRRWLDEPDKAKEILIASEVGRSGKKEGRSRASAQIANRNIASEARPIEVGSGASDLNELAPEGDSLLVKTSPQLSLDWNEVDNRRNSRVAFPPRLGVSYRSSSLTDWAGKGVGVIVLALGFEERTLGSARRILEAIRPEKLILVEYDEEQGRGIRDLVLNCGIPFDVVRKSSELADSLMREKGFVIVDTSGLSKPFLFSSVRAVLDDAKRIGIVHTLAQDYYPRNEDLTRKGVSASSTGPDILEQISDVLVGEAGPYHLESVHQEPAEPERWRALLASASPKNDRLLHLLDVRQYEATRILVPPPTTPRRRIAVAAAELAASAAEANVQLVEVGTNEIEAALDAINRLYGELYFQSGANVEIGLTGSKIHAVGFAALAAAARISQAWYVAPASVDEKRFTVGLGETSCFELLIER